MGGEDVGTTWESIKDCDNISIDVVVCTITITNFETRVVVSSKRQPYLFFGLAVNSM